VASIFARTKNHKREVQRAVAIAYDKRSVSANLGLSFDRDKNTARDICLIFPPSGGIMKSKSKITAALLLRAAFGKAPRPRRPTTQPSPWAPIGISRATWCRQGKPTRKARRLTQPQAAAQLKISVRSLQRPKRVSRLEPGLVPLLADGKMTVREAEARALAREQRQDEATFGHRFLISVAKRANLAAQICAW
jgi:hypothetical protein